MAETNRSELLAFALLYNVERWRHDVESCRALLAWGRANPRGWFDAKRGEYGFVDGSHLRYVVRAYRANTILRRKLRAYWSRGCDDPKDPIRLWRTERVTNMTRLF